jgi:hypothetical protein
VVDAVRVDAHELGTVAQLELGRASRPVELGDDEVLDGGDPDVADTRQIDAASAAERGSLEGPGSWQDEVDLLSRFAVETEAMAKSP